MTISWGSCSKNKRLLAKNRAFDGPTGKETSTISTTTEPLVWFYSHCPLCLCPDAVCNASGSAFLLSSSHPRSSLGLHPVRLQINLSPNIVQTGEGSCHPVNAGLVAIWLCQLNWEQLLSAHLSYVVVGHQWGKWPGLFLVHTPANRGDSPMRTRECPQTAASHGLATLPIPFLHLVDSQCWSLEYLHQWLLLGLK